MPEYIARRLQTCTAWKYAPDEPVPVWVVRHCHFLGDGKFTANTAMGAMEVDVGDYVVALEDEGGIIGVVIASGTTFEKDYEIASVAKSSLK